MKVFFLADEDGNILGLSSSSVIVDGTKYATYGTFRPVIDGDYYDNLLTFFDVGVEKTPKEKWLDWLKMGLSDGFVKEDGAFAFDIEDLRWIEFEEAKKS